MFPAKSKLSISASLVRYLLGFLFLVNNCVLEGLPVTDALWSSLLALLETRVKEGWAVQGASNQIPALFPVFDAAKRQSSLGTEARELPIWELRFLRCQDSRSATGWSLFRAVLLFRAPFRLESKLFKLEEPKTVIILESKSCCGFLEKLP